MQAASQPLRQGLRWRVSAVAGAHNCSSTPMQAWSVKRRGVFVVAAADRPGIVASATAKRLPVRGGASSFTGSCAQLRQTTLLGPRRASRTSAVHARAMVNVDFASPSLVLGAALVGLGVLLLQMRNMETRVSRDADIVVAAMISIVGSTLIFQGWRLDPLLLLCQALTTSVAFWYGLETFRLRQQTEQMMEEMQQQPGLLPRPEASTPQQDMRAAPQQAELSSRFGPAPVQQPTAGVYLPPGQQTTFPWGQQQQQQQQQASTSGRLFNETTIRYDYYGNPLPQQQAFESIQYGSPAADYGYEGGGGYTQASGSPSPPYGDPMPDVSPGLPSTAEGYGAAGYDQYAGWGGADASGAYYPPDQGVGAGSYGVVVADGQQQAGQTAAAPQQQQLLPQRRLPASTGVERVEDWE